MGSLGHLRAPPLASTWRGRRRRSQTGMGGAQAAPRAARERFVGRQTLPRRAHEAAGWEKMAGCLRAGGRATGCACQRPPAAPRPRHAPATHSLFSASSRKRERLCTRLDSNRSFLASTCTLGWAATWRFDIWRGEARTAGGGPRIIGSSSRLRLHLRPIQIARRSGKTPRHAASTRGMQHSAWQAWSNLRLGR